FVCLTDLPEIPGVETIPLRHDWPRWWPKIELFRPNLFPGPVAFFDLDMVILRDLAFPDPDTLPNRGIAVHRDLRNPKGIGSALMLWTQGAADFLYLHFADSAADFMRTYKGDQDYIHGSLVDNDGREFTPPWTWASYKWHIKAHGPDGFDIAAFHGKPRPWDVPEPWIPTFPAPPQAMLSWHSESQHALVICWWGGEPTRVAAARRALSHTAKLDRAGDVYFVERMPASGESRFPELPTEWIRLPIPHDPRAAGLFLKEAYWNYGAHRAIEDGHASLAFLDADYWVEDVAWLRDTASCVVDGVLLQPWTTWVESGSKRGGSMASGRGTSPGGSLALTVRTFEDMGGWYEGCIQGGGDAVNYARLTGKKAKWNELKFMYVQHAISRYKAKPLAVNALPHTLHHERHNIGETYKGAQRGIPLDLFCGTRVERVLTVDAHGLPVVDAATVRGQAFRGYLATSGRRDRDGRFRDVDQARHAAGLGRYLSASEWAAVKDADKWYAIRWTYYNEAIWMLRELFPGDDVLEVGCGKLPLVHDSTRIDQEPVKRGIVHNLDQYPWPVPRGQCVLALQVMEHLADGHRAATEIRRVARGAVVSIPYVWGPSRDKGHAGLDLSTLCDWFEAEPVRVAITGLRPRQRLVAAFMWGASDA
ncbi:MAG: hypothetical protein HN380_29110, partial [Victivallales bacterium]|nr:hypothetical protein [Victivallales bacterium]